MRASNWLRAIAVCFALVACERSQTSEPPANALIHETSPYLLQHAYNPVDWQPWSDRALEQAQQENKLMVVSIGYAACHWCHVMEHESFEDSAVAALMNEHFVSIKVDREERPDVDQVYMAAAQLMTGRGGWPLNVITLPDGRPVYAGTYFPKDRWMSVLRQVQEAYVRTPDRLEEIATQVTEGVRSDEVLVPTDGEPAYEPALLDELYYTWKPQLDTQRGGNRGAPKFPVPINGQFMLQYAYHTGNTEAYDWVATTLEQMARGGIYDHLGGGFARYATDAAWRVPHFEKMLYDNAQLVSLYSQAYRVSQDPLYRRVVYETLDFVAREMTSDEGAFYSSLDADSEGEEGKFYVWTAREIDQTLGDEAALFKDYYHVSAGGNWEEGKNILYVDRSDSAFAAQHALLLGNWRARLQESKRVLLAVRGQRVRPGLDDKSLTAWNALMISGYVDAYRTFSEPRFLEAALRNAYFLQKKVIGSAGAMTRSYKQGTATIDAFLDDYALTIAAFINLYQATFDASWLSAAQKLQEYAQEHFYDEASGLFFYTSDSHPALIARKKEVNDNVIPASNSVMAHNFYRLGLLLYQTEYVKQAEMMLAPVTERLRTHPRYYANWASLLAQMVYPPYEVAIVGSEWAERRKALDQHYLPNALLLGGENEGNLTLLADKLVPGQTTIYVCQRGACKLPVTEASRAVEQIVPTR